MEALAGSSDMDTNRPEELNQSISSGMNRFGIFQILMRNAFDGVSSGVSEDSYVKLFGRLSALKKSKSAPMKMKKTVTAKLLESLNSYLEQMVQEENVEEKFNTLETLVEECALHEGRETWLVLNVLATNASTDCRSKSARKHSYNIKSFPNQ